MRLCEFAVAHADLGHLGKRIWFLAAEQNLLPGRTAYAMRHQYTKYARHNVPNSAVTNKRKKSQQYYNTNTESLENSKQLSPTKTMSLVKNNSVEPQDDGVIRKIRYTSHDDTVIKRFVQDNIISQEKKVFAVKNWIDLAKRWTSITYSGISRTAPKLLDRYRRIIKQEKARASGESASIVYVIGLIEKAEDTVDTCKKVYIGETTNSTIRIRQHNAEIKGGAHDTVQLLHLAKKAFPAARWVYILQVRGFPFDKHNKLAKSLEHKLKHEVDEFGNARMKQNWRTIQGIHNKNKASGLIHEDCFVRRTDENERAATLDHLKSWFTVWKNNPRINKFGDPENAYIHWFTKCPYDEEKQQEEAEVTDEDAEYIDGLEEIW